MSATDYTADAVTALRRVDKTMRKHIDHVGPCDLRPKSNMHVVTEIDAGSGALCSRNPYSAELTDRVAFFDVDDAGRSLTADPD